MITNVTAYPSHLSPCIFSALIYVSIDEEVEHLSSSDEVSTYRFLLSLHL